MRHVARRVATGMLSWLAVAGVAGAQESRPNFRVRVSRVAFDSVRNQPLGGARIRLVPVREPGSARVVEADAQGNFGVDSVSAGTWLATMLHPRLDSLGVEPAVVRIDIREPSDVSLVLATPSPRALALGRCGALAPDLGLIFGTVRSARDEAAVPGARVRLGWPEWVIPKRGRGIKLDMQQREGAADSLGRYAVCGVPVAGTVRLLAWNGADSSGMLRVDIDSAGLAQRDVSIAASRALTASPEGDALTDSSGREGDAVVRGRALDINGRPVVGAIARVMGSGRAGRSGDDGTFEVRGAVAGTQSLDVRAIGFEPSREAVELRDRVTREVQVTLGVQRVLLDTVRVVAGRKPNAALAGFERRWKSGVGGAFMDGATVRGRAPIFLTDALRAVNGVSVQPVGGYGQRILMRDMSGNLCRPQLFVDGVPLVMAGGHGEFFLDDFVDRGTVTAMEVYARGGVVPAEYMNSSG